ncbi:class II glutamine amidotransferase [Corynebacterium guangdongense]|uniref:Glutamine amidotransferase n=1 Tax=Corynebacterium guangdongense TaxID=1783348 RepID=A0ABU1ZTS8_9CORY|nr:class II glutamine amidotransferase [Corynebacterium guangdongense]MDR7328339.1 glutamine amidotransferase [Corynebacterium guangdongense]WJZ16916.1 Amidohydrolase EgtC [Corynebacterium guangdongense]
MCRLFGLAAGRRRISASFWLLDAPYSILLQSHRNPDGAGLGTFDEDGRPRVEKAPIAAYLNTDFAREAKERHSCTFLAHLRYGTGTPVALRNTHPFEMEGRLCAHNGNVADLPALKEHLGPDLARVHGDTDSELVFALITRETLRAGGDVVEGVSRALSWLADNVPVSAVNLIITSAHEMWAVRWPDTHDLFLIDNRVLSEPMDRHSSHGMRIRSAELGEHPSVLVASEKLDDSRGWQLIQPGELIHVSADLSVTRTRVIDGPPRFPLAPITHD